MRIIAGEFRGRRLLPPISQATRPITDRVKQSLFDVLAPTIESASVADCFSGTGSMGLECLSRGAASVHFFEADRSALARLRRNIAELGVTNRSRIHGGDLFHWFAQRSNVPANPFNLLFLDPPYRYLREASGPLQDLAATIGRCYLSTEGIVIFRHDSRDRLELPPLHPYDRREYGSMTLEFLRIPTGDHS